MRCPLTELVREPSQFLFFTGKGGVGKTTTAAAIATELARRGFTVHLSPTDPAAHVAAVAGNGNPRLRVSRIDPAAELQSDLRRAHIEP